jgi:hypothetical protein
MAKQRIKLNLADFGFNPSSRRAKMQAIADMVLADWHAAARQSGMSARLLPAYLRALSIREVSADRCVVELAGAAFQGGDREAKKIANLAMMAEFGMGPGGIGTSGAYDIRTFVLKEGTRKLHLGKKGWYVNVPFDHTTASIKARGGPEALAMAQKLRHRMQGPDGGMTWDQRGKALALRRRMPEDMAPKIAKHHATDPLAGMVRLGSTYSRGADGAPRIQTSGYRTWRRMSVSGKPWMHPGVHALRLGERVGNTVPAILKRLGV